MKNRIFTIMLAITLVQLMLFGCAGMRHTKKQTMPAKYDVSVAEGTRIAAQAMQRTGFMITRQNDATGYLFGEKVKGAGIMRETFYLEVHIGKDVGSGLKVQATSIAGPEIAFTDELDDRVDEFFVAFSDIFTAKYSIHLEKKPPVKFEKRVTPQVPPTEVPGKKIAPQKRPSPEQPTEPSDKEYEL